MSSLLIISPGFPKDDYDSTCLPSQQLFVRCLNEVFPEIKCTVLALHYPKSRTPYLWRGNTVIPLDGMRYGKILRPILWREAFSAALQHFKEKPLGVVSFWCQEAALIGNMIASKWRVPQKIWICGQDARKGNLWLKLVKPRAEQLVAMSDFLQHEFENNYRIRPAHVVYNGIDGKNVNRHDEKTIDLVFVGSLISLKRPQIFVEVVGRVAKSLPGLKAVMAGIGEQREAVKRQINAAGLNHLITLTGELQHDDVLNLLAQSKILVHPSDYEGYSTVCLEALATGCKVISFTFPEKNSIPDWTVVSSVDQMAAFAETLLVKLNGWTPHVVHDMHDSVRQFVNLFPNDAING